MSRDVTSATVKKWRDFVDLLVSLTGKKKIIWNEGAREGDLVAAYAQITISLHRNSVAGRYDEDEPIIEVFLHDSSGDTVDFFDDSDLSDDDDHVYYRKLDGLMKNVARQLSGAEEILDSVLAKMGKDDDEIPF